MPDAKCEIYAVRYQGLGRLLVWPMDNNSEAGVHITMQRLMPARNVPHIHLHSS